MSISYQRLSISYQKQRVLCGASDSFNSGLSCALKVLLGVSVASVCRSPKQSYRQKTIRSAGEFRPRSL